MRAWVRIPLTTFLYASNIWDGSERRKHGKKPRTSLQQVVLFWAKFVNKGIPETGHTNRPVVPRLVEMPKRKLQGDGHVPLHTASKYALVKALVEQYHKEIDEACSKASMPEWCRDVVSNEVIEDPIVLPCGHTFHRENLLYEVLKAKPFTMTCPVPGCKQKADLQTVRMSSSLALKRDIQREQQRRQVCYDAKYEELLLKMQEDTKQALDAAVHKRLKRAH
jgi:hypothetical protein